MLWLSAGTVAAVVLLVLLFRPSFAAEHDSGPRGRVTTALYVVGITLALVPFFPAGTH